MTLDDLRLENDRRLSSVLMAIVLVPAAWFGAAQWAATRSPADLVPHVASALIAALTLWFLCRARTREAFSRLVLASTISVVPVLLIIGLQRPHGWFYQPSQALLPLVGLYGALPNTFARQVAAPLLFSAGLIGGRLFWLPGIPEGSAFGDVLLLTIINAVGILMVWRRVGLQVEVNTLSRQKDEAWECEREARDVTERALRDLKALRGIIPICSVCKKVRTGDGEWQQIERYVHNHSDADFSHGVCPDCARTLYPEFADPDATALPKP